MSIYCKHLLTASSIVF